MKLKNSYGFILSLVEEQNMVDKFGLLDTAEDRQFFYSYNVKGYEHVDPAALPRQLVL